MIKRLFSRNKDLSLIKSEKLMKSNTNHSLKDPIEAFESWISQPAQFRLMYNLTDIGIQSQIKPEECGVSFHFKTDCRLPHLVISDELAEVSISGNNNRVYMKYDQYFKRIRQLFDDLEQTVLAQHDSLSNDMLDPQFQSNDYRVSSQKVTTLVNKKGCYLLMELPHDPTQVVRLCDSTPESVSRLNNTFSAVYKSYANSMLISYKQEVKKNKDAVLKETK